LSRDQSVDQADRAVMAHLQAVSQFPHRHPVSSAKPFDREQRLMLLRRNSRRTCGGLAKQQEATERVP